MIDPLVLAASGVTDTGVANAGKAIALGVGAGLGSIGARIGIGLIFGNAVRENIEAAGQQRREADEMLADYRERLAEARNQADEIVARARKASEAALAEAAAVGKERREELIAAARRDIDLETQRSLERIRQEVADLTVIATEKVTRKTLDADDQRRLVEEALAEVDFSALAGAEAEEAA